MTYRIGLALAILAVAIGSAQQTASPVYTAAQAAAGRAAYEERCAACHLTDLGGRNEAPQLAGNDFINTWRNRSTKDLFDFISGTMPPDGAMLTPEQYTNIVAYILQQNGAAAGQQAFASTVAVSIGTVATGQRPAAAPQVAAGGGGRGAPGAQGAGGGRGQAPGGGRGAGRGAGGLDDDIPVGRGRGQAGPAVARGLTVKGEVKNYVPVTDAMLRNP